jgi:hypothetical protein
MGLKPYLSLELVNLPSSLFILAFLVYLKSTPIFQLVELIRYYFLLWIYVAIWVELLIRVRNFSKPLKITSLSVLIFLLFIFLLRRTYCIWYAAKVCLYLFSYSSIAEEGSLISPRTFSKSSLPLYEQSATSN